MKTLKPVIKWSGSKRSQLSVLGEHLPVHIEKYIEPFVGGGSVFGYLLLRGGVEKFEISDLNSDLIKLWKSIQNTPDQLVNHYNEVWKGLKACENLGDKKTYYNVIRERLNEEHNPYDFMFILRTCVNGMPRYSNSGRFNTSYHLNRDGMKPETLKSIVFEWSELINNNRVTFENKSYSSIKTDSKDFMYLDPPYANTKGMYFGGFDNLKFFNWLSGQEANWLLSYDGKSGDVDSTYQVPKELYSIHKYLKAGNSSFKRTMTGNKDAQVYESLYIK